MTLATATAGCTPMKISSGVIRNPPPMPNMPEMNPTAKPHREHQKDVDGNVGDRKVNLHGWTAGRWMLRLNRFTRALPRRHTVDRRCSAQI